jgi:hypothetical protein
MPSEIERYPMKDIHFLLLGLQKEAKEMEEKTKRSGR